MNEAALIINRALPILLLIGLGYWIRRSAFIAESSIDDLRKLVVNIALPAVLFLAFLDINLEATYIVIFVLVFLLNLLLFGFGRLLKGWLNSTHIYFPFLMTGFEMGMMGIPLFGSAYGLDNVSFIAIFDVGHELFIWFVYLAFLLIVRDGSGDMGTLTGAFIRSPVILGIVAGLLLNILGARDLLFDTIGLGGVMGTLEFLSALIVPLILIIVGYGIKIDREGIREALPVIVIRLGLLIPLALILNVVVIRGALGLGPPFEAAMFTLLILPPPFIIPLYMGRDLPPEERRYVNNVLTLHTVASLIVFGVYFVLNPVI